jgi:serine/threonine-protein kinase
VEQAGRYRVVRRIGEGGMAEVFEGEALGEGGFRRRVAIKRLLADNARDEDFRRMFLDEARIASQLHHAGVVSIVDFGISEGVPFQVLEYVDGPSVARLRELAGEMPVEVALAIGTEIAHALDHAHHATDAEGRKLGIVHRDVSPGNILVSWSGDVKLTDFGIAFARGRVVTTSVGVAKGTLQFMAPEQVLRGEMDGRTDVFGLGCVLALLVSGESPLSAEGAMADLVAGGELKLAATMPEDVRAIVAKATRLQRRDRWETAAQMAAAMGTALARRADKDGKTLLRDFLGKVRGESAGVVSGAEKKARLDAALNLELVLAGTAGQVREFRMRPSVEMRVVSEEVLKEGRARRPTVKLDRPLVVPEAEKDEVPLEPPVATWRRVVVPGLVVLAVLGILWGAIRERAPAVVLLADAMPAEVDAAVTAPDAAVPGRAEEDGEEMVEGGVRDGAPPARDVVVVPPPTPDAGPSKPPKPPDDENVPPSVTLGTLVIGGEGALKSEIFVDGKSRGFAPKTLELRLGDHDVVLVAPDGTRRTKHITLEARHTSSSPARWSVPLR